MAIITSHVLNGTDGTHAAGIDITLSQIGNSKPLLTTATDEAGRVTIELNSDNIDVVSRYELVFATAKYWQSRGIKNDNILNEIVLRFQMSNANGKFHMPIIISPFSYSTWKSG